MLVVFLLFYHRIMYCRLLVLKDWCIRKAMDEMTEEMDKLEYGNMTDTDLLKEKLARWLQTDDKLYNLLVGVDSLFIDTIMVPLLYDGMVACMLIWDLWRFGQSGLSRFEFIYSIIVCVLVGISLCCYVCISCATRGLRMNIDRR